MAQDELLVGAAGQMFSLLIPENGGFTESPVKVGSLQQGVSGARTYDIQGVRRDFTYTVEDIGPEDYADLEALYFQVRAPGRPIRLFIPHRINLLSPHVSSGGSVAPARVNPSPWYTSAVGSLSYQEQVQRADQDVSYPLTPRLTRSTFLQCSTVGGATFYPEGNPAAGTPYAWVPVVPGRQYTLSILYKTSAGATVTFGTTQRREDGTNVTAASTTSLSATTSWTWASRTWTPSTGYPYQVPQITLANGNTMSVAAMQMEEGSTRTDWHMGAGVPVVAATSLSATHTLWPRRTVSMSFAEL